SLQVGMSGFGNDLRQAATETLALAGVPASDVGRVILVGGSSLMRVVIDMGRDLFPGAPLQHSQVFTAVVDGLALATEKQSFDRRATPGRTPVLRASHATPYNLLILQQVPYS